jgi:hypothetical protein
MSRLLDWLDDIPAATVGYYIGTVFGGIYLLVELLMGAGSVPEDFTLTPTAYFAFVTGGAGLLGIGRGIMAGKRAEAAAIVDSNAALEPESTGVDFRTVEPVKPGDVTKPPQV